MATAPKLNKADIDQLINRALASHNFWEFCLYYDPEFFTHRDFLKQVAEAFQAVYENYKEGKAIKVAVSMPPRAGKSYITSLFCAWWLGKFPTLSVMRNACTARLYQKFSYDVRTIVKSDKYADVFPGIRLATDKQNLDGWNLETSKQVGYFGAGVGGTIIGFGANIAITDDLYKDLEAALSEAVQEGVSMWKQSAHNSRMERACPEIFIGTRWTLQDEIGKAIDSGNIDIEIKIPALIVEEDGTERSFCEHVKTTAEYLKIRENTGKSIWEAEYQQEPIEMEGLLFPQNTLQYFHPDQLGDIDFTFLPVDPADTGGDYTSAPLAKLSGKGVFITDVLFNKRGTDYNIPTLVGMIVKNKTGQVNIESNAAWVLFTKQVRSNVHKKDRNRQIIGVQSTTNKEARILSEYAWIRNNCYFLHPEHWTQEYRDFMKNLTSYLAEGKNKHDDAPDSMAMVAKFYQSRFPKLWLE